MSDSGKSDISNLNEKDCADNCLDLLAMMYALYNGKTIIRSKQ